MAVELKYTRDLRRDNWLNPDGSFAQRNATGDLYYKNHLLLGDGDAETLRKVDVTPAQNDTGWLVQFAPYNAQIPLLSDTMLQYVDVRYDGVNDKQMPINIECVGVGSVKGELIGDEVVYTDAYGPGAHLVYKMLRHGVTKLVRVDPSSEVRGPFVFNLYTDAKWTVERKDGIADYELSKATPKALNSGKKTVFVSDSGETYLRPFSWRSGVREGGILPVVMEYIADGVWQITKDVPPEWSRESAIDMDVSATSTLSYDGHLECGGGGTYASLISAAAATTHTGAAATMLQYNKGSAATRYVDRPYMIFANTVDASATITDCTVSAYCVTRVALSSTPVSPIGALVDFVPTSYTSVAVGDFARGTIPPNHIGNTALAADQTITAASARYTWTINSPATNVAKNTYNGWALREYATTVQGDCDMRGTTYAGAAGYAEYNTGEAGSNIPIETITYTMPVVQESNPFMMMGVG